MYYARCGSPARGGLFSAGWASSFRSSDRDGRRTPGGPQEKPGTDPAPLSAVFDIGLGAVRACSGLGVPFAVRGLVLDRLGTPRRPLFARRPLGGRQRRSVAGKALRKHTVDGVGPTAVMLNDLVGDVGHRELAGWGWRSAAHSMA